MIEDQCRSAEAHPATGMARRLSCLSLQDHPASFFASLWLVPQLRLHGLFESMRPTSKSAQERNLQRAILDFADALRRRLEPARCWRSRRRSLHKLADRCDAAFDCSKTIASTRRKSYFAFFFAPFLFAVLRAVFFAADFVFDFAFFAILPS